MSAAPSAEPVQLLSVDAVAKVLDESPWTVRLLIRRGDLKAYRTGRGSRGKYRIHPDQLQAFLDERITQ